MPEIECLDCHHSFPATSDHFHKNGLGGLRHVCKECAIKRTLKWQQENPATESRYKYVRRWVLNNPDKVKAHSTVHRAIKTGKLVRGPCEVCGSTKVQAHHDDYTKRLEVRWLCNIHHNLHHRK